MRRLTTFSILGFLLCASAARSQAPDPKAQTDQDIATLVKEIQAQQISIAANQTQIDEKLAAVAEAVRVARIYSSRGGR